MHLPKTALD